MTGVMDLYMPVGIGAGPDGLGQMAAPPGVQLSDGFSLLGEITSRLGLKHLGVYTPWATRQGATGWELVQQPPSTNIAVAALNQAAIEAALKITFSQPLPFIAIVTERLPTPSEVEATYDGTPYQFYETQAVYRQDDTDPTPRIWFLHWGRFREAGDPQHGRGNMDKAAADIQGRLVFAMQVNYPTTATRSPPAVPFENALAVQFGTGTPPNGGAVQPPGPEPPEPVVTPPPTAPKTASMWMYAGVGAFTGVATFLIVREARKKKK